MTFDELLSELRGRVDERRASDPAGWADTSILVAVEALDLLLEELDRALADWQPVATAPAGELLLVWGNGPMRFGLLDQHGNWRARHRGPLRTPPTRWRRLPPPPVSAP